MSATQKELREAYARGMTALGAPPDFVQTESLVAYPRKMKQRRREVELGGRWYRIFNGCVQTRSRNQGPDGWENAFSLVDTRTLADLFANPTEEVEVDE